MKNKHHMSRLSPIKHIPVFLLLFSTKVFGASLSFNGNTLPVIEITPDKSSGIDRIYVVDNLNNVSITLDNTLTNSPEWYIYGELGGGYAERIENIIYNEKKSTLEDIKSDHGYIINDGNDRYIFWIIDYSKYPDDIIGINLPLSTECDGTTLSFSGGCKPIYYYTINGKRETLSRDIKLTYYNLEWDEESMNYNQVICEKQFASIDGNIYLPPIYCLTIFSISEDRFMSEWGRSKNIESDQYYPNAVAVTTVAQKADNNISDNLRNSDIDGLGGSAPCLIEFRSYITDAVMHTEWQMSDTPDFNNTTYRITQQDFDYTFTQAGTTYVRCIVSNADGSCEYTGDTYTVNIGVSELLIPNTFSPDNDGINDIWKVSYNSILDFQCWIFDRQGHQLFYFDSPDKGWDGKSNGKYVKPGVYYYVITATGSDGKRYKKSGDINIINYKSNRSSGSNAN